MWKHCVNHLLFCTFLKDQICSHVHPDVSLQVYMYYGAERLRDVKFLRQQDIVLTTYPTLTNDYSRVSIEALCTCDSQITIFVGSDHHHCQFGGCQVKGDCRLMMLVWDFFLFFMFCLEMQRTIKPLKTFLLKTVFCAFLVKTICPSQLRCPLLSEILMTIL